MRVYDITTAKRPVNLPPRLLSKAGGFAPSTPNWGQGTPDPITQGQWRRWYGSRAAHSLPAFVRLGCATIVARRETA